MRSIAWGSLILGVILTLIVQRFVLKRMSAA